MTAEDKQWIQELLEAMDNRVSERLEASETRILTEFHKWASPFERAKRSHSEALRALDVSYENHEDRTKALERRRALIVITCLTKATRQLLSQTLLFCSATHVLFPSAPQLSVRHYIEMDLQKMITELEAERDRLDEAILALERLSTANQAKRRARVSNSLSASGEEENGTGSAVGAEELPPVEAKA